MLLNKMRAAMADKDKTIQVAGATVTPDWSVFDWIRWLVLGVFIINLIVNAEAVANCLLTERTRRIHAKKSQ